MSDVSPYLVSPYLQRPLRSYEEAFRELQARRLRHGRPKSPALSCGEAKQGFRRLLPQA